MQAGLRRFVGGVPEMGSRAFKNGEAHAYLDNDAVLSPREERAARRALAADDQRWTQMAQEQYESSTGRLTRDVDQVLRICESGTEAVDSILADLRSGEISATEAAKAINAARRDVDKLRRLAKDAEQAEGQAWEAVNLSPAEYQEALMRRAPMLFAGNRNLLVLPTADDE